MEKSGNIYIIEAEDNFKKVHKSIIENPNIDCETLGIYTRIIVLGTKWNLNIKGLSSHLDLSDTRIRKAVSVLEKEGYIVRTAVRGDRGKFYGWNYNVLPIPAPEEYRSSAGKPTSQKSDTRSNGLVRQPTCPSTDLSENGEDNIYRLKEYIDLNNNKTIYDIDKEKVEKESQDFSMEPASPSVPEKKEEKKSCAKRKEERNLDLPFTSDRFMETWNILSQMPKWRKKTDNALQMSLNKLKKYDEAFAIELMENAIAGDYQGLVFADTDRKYDMWKKGRERQADRDLPPKGVRDCFFDPHKEWDEAEEQFQRLLDSGAYDTK